MNASNRRRNAFSLQCRNAVAENTVRGRSTPQRHISPPYLLPLFCTAPSPRNNLNQGAASTGSTSYEPSKERHRVSGSKCLAYRVIPGTVHYHWKDLFPVPSLRSMSRFACARSLLCKWCQHANKEAASKRRTDRSNCRYIHKARKKIET